MFDIVIMAAKYAGKAEDGSMVKVGDTIAYHKGRRKVVTANAERIAQIRADQAAQEHDMHQQDVAAERISSLNERNNW